MIRITIKAWSTHQSYKDRDPKWIKFHCNMLDSSRFHRLSSEAQALLPMLWLLACEHKDPKAGIIETDCEDIAFRLRKDFAQIEQALEELARSINKKGEASFLVVEQIDTTSVSKPYPIQNTEKRREEERREDKHKERPSVAEATLEVCNHKMVIELYNEILPEMPTCKIQLWAKSRRELDLKNWWKAGYNSEEFWRAFFLSIRKNNHWMGREGWKGAHLGWMLERKKFIVAVEKMEDGRDFNGKDIGKAGGGNTPGDRIKARNKANSDQVPHGDAMVIDGESVRA